MRLVARARGGPAASSARTSARRVEQAGDPRELRRASVRGRAARARPGGRRRRRACARSSVGQRHRLGCDLEVEPVGDEEAVDHVESASARPSIRVTTPSSTTSSGSGSFGPSRDEPELRQRRHEQLAPKLLLGARGEAGEPPAAQAPQTPLHVRRGRLADEGRRPRRAQPSSRAPTPRARKLSSGPAAAPCRSRGAGRRGRGQLGRTLEVVGELEAAGRAGDRGLARQRPAVARTSGAARLRPVPPRE